MIKKFVFDGIEYATERAVRQAIFQKDRKAIGKLKNADDWAKHGVTYTEEQEPIEVLKQQKSFAIKQAFLNWRSNRATLVSSLGFKADANERANSDVNGLLIAHEGNRDSLITFRDADNAFHSLTFAQMKILQKEIIANGAHAYAQKWTFDSLVENATTEDELSAIEVKFEGKDFSKE